MMAYRIVKCPKCGKYRKTSSIKIVRCFSCGKSFSAVNHMISNENYKKEIGNKKVEFSMFKS